MKYNKQKKKKIVILSVIFSICFAIIGVLAFFIGAYMAGWEIYKWFTSGTALLIYAIVFVVLTFLISLLLIKKDDE